MIYRHRSCFDQPGTRMTALALTGRTTKDTGDMATLTIHIPMGAFQRITGRKVIELGAECRLTRGWHNRQRHNYSQKYKSNNDQR